MKKHCESPAENTYLLPDVNSVVPPGMLSSPQIAYCIDKLEIIRKSDLKECLDSASYHMRIGGPVLTWKDGIEEDYYLAKEENKIKKFVKKIRLRPNSLTFVTTIEEFNLPKDIIARFNLKSKFVHKGLLLGTGPIVDPELQGRLLIPIHNFSSQDVELWYGEKIISVEFTKTLNPDENILGRYKYVNNKNWNLDFDGYRKRILNQKVESSVSSSFESYARSIEQYKESIKTIENQANKALRKFNVIAAVTTAATYISLIVLVITTWSIIMSCREKLDEANNTVYEYDKKLSQAKSFATLSDQENLRKEIEAQQSLIEGLRKRIEEYEKEREDNHRPKEQQTVNNNSN